MKPAGSRPVSTLAPYTDHPPLTEEHGFDDGMGGYGSGAGVPNASTSTFRPGSGLWGGDAYSKADEAQGEDESEDEDWNVYDDFNNVRPLSKGPVHAGLTDPYYDDPETRGIGGLSTSSFDDDERIPLPAGQRPANALLANAFGFDVQNSDPRTWTEEQRAAAALAKERNAINQPNPEHQLELADHGIEMITVPALGAEYTDEERKRMTTPWKRKQKRKSKQRGLAAWARGESKCLGLDCRAATFIAFFSCIALALTLFFVIPRVPSFGFLSSRPLDAYPDEGSMEIGHDPLNFSMTMVANMRANNKGSYIPIKIKDMNMKVRDMDTNALVGEGHMDGLSLKSKQKKEFQFPIDFSYKSINLTGDATFLKFYQGCGPKWPGTSRPVLKLVLSMEYKVNGMIGTKGSGTTLSNVACPFTLEPTQ